jgi:uncharacterized protein
MSDPKDPATVATHDAYARTERTRLKRRAGNGSYDRDLVHAILDAGLICHVGFVVDGQPFVTPSAYWRMDEAIYWHGSVASRMLRAITDISVCITVSHVDGIIHARSGFNSCMNYRSVMMFGIATVVSDPVEKTLRLAGLLDRLAPGRAKDSKPSTPNEIKATTVMRLDLAEVSAKVRTGDVGDPDEDLALPHWAGIVPIRTIVGEPIDDPMLRPGIVCPDYIKQIKVG